jgi:micrococcal nuclease
LNQLGEFRRRKRIQSLTRLWGQTAPGVVLLLMAVLAVFILTGKPPGVAAPAPFDGTGSTVAVAGGDFTLCGRRRDRCVIDGDTIRYDGVRIRIEDIDTPETHDPKCGSELALGQRATRRLLDLVNAGPFEIVYTGGRDHDRYGRELRRLERGGKSLGDILVEEGLARRWDGARHPWCD